MPAGPIPRSARHPACGGSAMPRRLDRPAQRDQLGGETRPVDPASFRRLEAADRVQIAPAQDRGNAVLAVWRQPVHPLALERRRRAGTEPRRHTLAQPRRNPDGHELTRRIDHADVVSARAQRRLVHGLHNAGNRGHHLHPTDPAGGRDRRRRVGDQQHFGIGQQGPAVAQGGQRIRPAGRQRDQAQPGRDRRRGQRVRVRAAADRMRHAGRRAGKHPGPEILHRVRNGVQPRVRCAEPGKTAGDLAFQPGQLCVTARIGAAAECHPAEHQPRPALPRLNHRVARRLRRNGQREAISAVADPGIAQRLAELARHTAVHDRPIHGDVDVGPRRRAVGQPAPAFQPPIRGQAEMPGGALNYADQACGATPFPPPGPACGGPSPATPGSG